MQYAKSERTLYGTYQETITAIRIHGKYVDPKKVFLIAKSIISAGVLTIATLISIMMFLS